MPKESRALGGVIAAAVTPRRPGSCEIDLGAALELIDWLCSRNVQGLALLGSTGEFVHFGADERSRLVHLGVKRSRVPVLANVSHSTFDLTVRLGREAADAGAAGLLLMPPYFFRYSATEVEHFFLEYMRELHRTVPVFLYNIPLFAPPIPLDVAQRLLATGQFAGIKDSGGHWDYLEALCQMRQEQAFTLLVGSDGLFLPARLAGADGVVSGISSAAPELLLALEAAILAGEEARQQELQERLQAVIGWLHHFPVPSGVKLMTGWRNQKVGPLATPLSPALSATSQEFHHWFTASLTSLIGDQTSA